MCHSAGTARARRGGRGGASVDAAGAPAVPARVFDSDYRRENSDSYSDVDEGTPKQRVAMAAAQAARDADALAAAKAKVPVL